MTEVLSKFVMRHAVNTKVKKIQGNTALIERKRAERDKGEIQIETQEDQETETWSQRNTETESEKETER